MSNETNSRLSRSKRLLIICLALFSLYLCVGIWVVPVVLISQIQKHGSAALGREVTVTEATFNPFSFETKLFGLEIGPSADGGEPLLTLGKASANPQLVSIFGTITLKSIELSDGELWVEKNENGSFSFQDVVEGLSGFAPAEDENAEPAALPAVIVKRLALVNLQARFKDRSLDTVYEESLTVVSLHGSDIGTVERSTLGTGEGESPYHWAFEGEIVTGSGASLALQVGATRIVPWTFEVKSNLAGFPLASMQPYVDQAVVGQLEGVFGFDLSSRINLADPEPQIELSGGVGLDSLAFFDSEQAFAEIERIALEGIFLAVPVRELSLESVVVSKPVISAILLPDGSPRLPQMVAESASVPSSPASSEMPAFEARIDTVAIAGGQVLFEDRSLAVPFSTRIENMDLTLEDLSAEQSGAGYDASGSLQLAMDILGGQFRLQSSLTSLSGVASAQLELDGLSLAGLQSYVQEQADAELMEGRISFRAAVETVTFDDPKVSASLSVSGLKIAELGTDREFVNVGSLSLLGVEYGGNVLAIERVELIEPLLTVWQNDLGLNLSRIPKIEQETERAVTEFEAKTDLAVSVGDLEIRSAGVSFMDTTLYSTLKSRVSDFSVSAQMLSTDPEQLAPFQFSGTIDGSSRLTGSGKVSAANPGRFLDLETQFKGYDLTATSPYWQTYLGRSLAKGQFEISTIYEVRDDQLKGSNSFRIDQLTLGQKVDSETALNLPIGFAIKLLQDPNGLIAYDGLKVEGDLSEPTVKPWGLIGRAVRNLILGAVASPFKFLAGMVGGGEDLDTIFFAEGSVSLDQSAMEKIGSLQAIMMQRPGLKLEFAFKLDPNEIEYLKSRYTLHLLANPDFRLVSGLDLLAPVNQAALRSRVEAEYMASKLEADPFLTATETEKPEPPKMEDSTVEDKKGIVNKIVSVFGFGRQAVEEGAPPVTEANGVESTPEGQEEEQVALPRFEEMLAAVLEAMPTPSFRSEWAVDLASERIQVFKQALVSAGEMDGGRLFVTDLSEFGDDKPTGALLLKLSE